MQKEVQIWVDFNRKKIKSKNLDSFYTRSVFPYMKNLINSR